MDTTLEEEACDSICYWRHGNRGLKCSGLTILRTDMTFSDNVTPFLAITTKFLRTIDNNMPILAAKTLQILEGIDDPCP